MNNSCRRDEQFILNVQWYLGGWACLMVCLIGVVGNSISIVVLSNKRMRNLSTNIYLLSLSVINLIWLLLYIFVNALRFTIIIPLFLKNTDEGSNNIHTYDQLIARSSPFVIPIMNTLQLCSIYYTVAVSIDRFLYLTYGIQADNICTIKNSLKIIFSLTIFSILFIIPNWLKYRVVHVPHNNKTQYWLKLTPIGENQIFKKIVHVYTYIPVVYMIPFIILIVINFLTIKLLYDFHYKRQIFLKTRPAKHDIRITLMLIGVVLLFFICRFPSLINHFFEVHYSITEDANEMTNVLTGCRTIRKVFNTVVNFLQTVNASANLIFYYVFGKTFRETSTKLACPMRINVTKRENTTHHIRRHFSASIVNNNIDNNNYIPGNNNDDNDRYFNSNKKYQHTVSNKQDEQTILVSSGKNKTRRLTIDNALLGSKDVSASHSV